MLKTETDVLKTEIADAVSTANLALNKANVAIGTANTALNGRILKYTEKAVDISADKITAGTLNAANVNIINLNSDKKYKANLVKVVKISEWNELQNTLNVLSNKIVHLYETQNTNKQEEK